jgi:protein CpxP
MHTQKAQTILQSFAPAARRTGMLLALGSALISAPLLAQDAGTPPQPQQQQQQDQMQGMHGNMQGMRGRHRRGMQTMKRELNLTDDQMSQIKQIREQGRDPMKALHDNTSMSQEDRRAKMKDMRKDQQDKIRAVLNDEQKEKFDTMMANRQEHHKKMHQQNEDAQHTAPPSV